MRIQRLLPGLLVMASLTVAGAKGDVAGRWDVTISTAEGTINGLATLKQTGDEVTGWVGPSENDPIPITGTLIKNKLVMKILPQPGRTVAFYDVELSVKGNTLSGAFERGSHGRGTITFVRPK